MTKYAAIPTKYNGLQFRSRLEAQWAAFFDLLDWDWKYEPFDLNGYIPDFILKFKGGNILIEVKPDIEYCKLAEHRNKIIKSGYKGTYIIVGSTYFKNNIGCEYEIELGPTGYINKKGKHYRDDGYIVIKCVTCQKYSIVSHTNTWECYMCGDGGKQIRYSDKANKDIDILWKTAKNKTQYINKK